MSVSPSNIPIDVLSQGNSVWDALQGTAKEFVFSGITFQDEYLKAIRYEVHKPITFIDCVFNRKCRFEYGSNSSKLRFERCKFKDNFDLQSVNFTKGTLEFVECEFEKDVVLDFNDIARLTLDSHFNGNVAVRCTGGSGHAFLGSGGGKGRFSQSLSIFGSFNSVVLDKTEFGELSLNQSTIGQLFKLSGSKVSGHVTAVASRFFSAVDFEKLQVGGDLLLINSEFRDLVLLRESYIQGNVDMSSSKDMPLAYLDASNARFDGKANFSNRTISGSTSFLGTRFGVAPYFHQTRLFPDTVFHGASFPGTYKGVPAEIASSAENAYRSLRSACLKIEAHADEQRFFEHEMRARRAMEKGALSSFLYYLYEVFSSYGQSIHRPLGWFAIHALVSLLFFWLIQIFSVKYYEPDCDCQLVFSQKRAIEVIALTGSQLLPFVPYFKETKSSATESGFAKELPVQTALAIWSSWTAIASIIFLFLIGLGVRNKFRLR